MSLAHRDEMLAAVFTGTGEPGVIRTQVRPVPHPGAGEVSIDVAFAGLNFADVLQRTGVYPAPMPYVPGLEVAGRVREVGAGVVGFDTGAEVAALLPRGGGQAEVVIADAALLTTVGSRLELAQAAALPVAGVTAYALLSRLGAVTSGDTVLVHAAAGGVGTLAGQIAKTLGAGLVIGTVGSEAKLAYAANYGFDHVLLREDFKGELARLTNGRGADVVLDSIGGRTSTESLASLAPLGRLVRFGHASGEQDEPLFASALMRTNAAVLGFSVRELAGRDPQLYNRLLKECLQLASETSLRADISEICGLGELASAHRRMQDGDTRGKILIEPARKGDGTTRG